jgi:hypothetical protein
VACADADERAAGRDRADPFLNRAPVLAALGYDSIDEYLRGPQREIVRAGMQTEFGLPVLRVATDDGYDPPLAEITDWVIEQARR